MTPPTEIFDTTLLRRRLERAVAGGYATFLVDRAADEMIARLVGVRRSFGLALDLASPSPVVARRMRALGHVDRVIRLCPIEAAGEGSVTGDAALLPFRSAPPCIDLVVSLLALSQVNDLPGCLLQVRKSLTPDGLFLGCLFGARTLTELRAAFGQAETEIVNGMSPRVAPFPEMRDAGALLQRAGFALPVADVEPLTVRYPNPFALMHDLRSMGLTNALTQRSRTFLRRSVLMRMAEIYAERFSDPDGRVRATFELIWLAGWAPDENQRKPLRPGSALVRLADALGTQEQKLSAR